MPTGRPLLARVSSGAAAEAQLVRGGRRPVWPPQRRRCSRRRGRGCAGCPRGFLPRAGGLHGWALPGRPCRDLGCAVCGLPGPGGEAGGWKARAGTWAFRTRVRQHSLPGVLEGSAAAAVAGTYRVGHPCTSKEGSSARGHLVSTAARPGPHAPRPAWRCGHGPCGSPCAAQAVVCEFCPSSATPLGLPLEAHSRAAAELQVPAVTCFSCLS